MGCVHRAVFGETRRAVLGTGAHRAWSSVLQKTSDRWVVSAPQVGTAPRCAVRRMPPGGGMREGRIGGQRRAARALPLTLSAPCSLFSLASCFASDHLVRVLCLHVVLRV